MKIWKILILVTGLAGIAGFFLPIVNYGGETSLSSFDIVRGGGDEAATSATNVINKAKDVGTNFEATKGMTETAAKNVASTGLAGLKGIIIGFFVPALILTLMGAVGIARGKFERLGGIFALILGIVSAAIWGVFFLGASGDGSVGLGLHMLLVAGLGGIVGGIGTIAKPDTDQWTGV
ncbi:MAG: hypothetical protein H0T79_13805 [Deltaproteobacteria bacterium]|nr:hypothetical protein [Deltaproteobacteria bacterium]